jgi:hypothetical protein
MIKYGSKDRRQCTALISLHSYGACFNYSNNGTLKPALLISIAQSLFTSFNAEKCGYYDTGEYYKAKSRCNFNLGEEELQDMKWAKRKSTLTLLQVTKVHEGSDTSSLCAGTDRVKP